MDNVDANAGRDDVSYASGVENRKSLHKRPSPPVYVIRDSSLIGRAGVALVEFQLARRGYDCIRTPERSGAGDLWAETGVGRVSIEVKTANYSDMWTLRGNQKKSEVYVFVNLDSAECYILFAVEIEAITAKLRPYKDGTIRVRSKAFPKGAFEGWDRLMLRAAPSVTHMNHIPIHLLVSQAALA